MNDVLTLSFCITCKNRLHQIRQTLKQNLDDNKLHSNFIDFVLVDFCSDDGLREWIVGNFQQELSSGLKYYHTIKLPQWHACVAKNTAHLCAEGDILVNLDCDNFTGIWGGAYVLRVFARYGLKTVIHQFSEIVGDGSYGRIAVLSKYFHFVGGYDELSEPMVYQDSDLIKRLVAIGLIYVNYSDTSYNRAIRNKKEEGISQSCSPKNYTQMIESNYNRSLTNLDEGRLIANNGKFGIYKGLFDHNGQPFYPNINKYGKL